MVYVSNPQKQLARVEQKGSSGEKQIARMLTHYDVPFVYEKPIAIRDRGHVRLWYPDFWLPDVNVYLEYNGMDGRYGEARDSWKKHVYKQEGIACVWVYPHDLHGYWPKRVLEDVARLARSCSRQFDAAAVALEAKVESRESAVITWDQNQPLDAI